MFNWRVVNMLFMLYLGFTYVLCVAKMLLMFAWRFTDDVLMFYVLLRFDCVLLIFTGVTNLFYCLLMCYLCFTKMFRMCYLCVVDVLRLFYWCVAKMLLAFYWCVIAVLRMFYWCVDKVLLVFYLCFIDDLLRCDWCFTYVLRMF